MASKSYRDLIAWQKAVDLAVTVYALSRQFPREEVYALTSQLRRAVVSVASNLAEGQGRSSKADFLRFARIASGSLQEMETQLIIAERLKYVTAEQSQDVLLAADEVGRLVCGLQKSLEACG